MAAGIGSALGPRRAEKGHAVVGAMSGSQLGGGRPLGPAQPTPLTWRMPRAARICRPRRASPSAERSDSGLGTESPRGAERRRAGRGGSEGGATCASIIVCLGSPSEPRAARSEPHTLVAALCLRLAVSISRGRCAAAAFSRPLEEAAGPPPQRECHRHCSYYYYCRCRPFV
jgi:hypothetical protein